MKTPQILITISNMLVSYINIFNLLHNFSPYFKEKVKIFNSKLDLNYDNYHAYETVIFINYQNNNNLI